MNCASLPPPLNPLNPMNPLNLTADFHSNGEGKEEAASPQVKKANPASLRSAAPSKGRGSRGHSLLPLEGGAPKGRRLDGESGIPETKPSPQGEGAPKGRIGQKRYEKEWGNASQIDDIREHPIHR